MNSPDTPMDWTDEDNLPTVRDWAEFMKAGAAMARVALDAGDAEAAKRIISSVVTVTTASVVYTGGDG